MTQTPLLHQDNHSFATTTTISSSTTTTAAIQGPPPSSEAEQSYAGNEGMEGYSQGRDGSEMNKNGVSAHVLHVCPSFSLFSPSCF